MRVIVIGGYAPSLINFRGPLLKALRSAGHEVIAVAPEMDTEVARQLIGWGIRYEPVPLSRAGLNPFADVIYLWRLSRLFRRLMPDVVLAYTHKPVVFSALATRLARQGRAYALVTGLGYAFLESGGLKQRLAGRVLRGLYKLASGSFSGVFFQNPDDAAVFRFGSLIRSRTPTCIVRGSGIDLAHFPVKEVSGGAPRFLLIARLLLDKGIREYAAAARKVRQRHPDAVFELVGPFDPNPASLKPEELDAWVASGDIVYSGPMKDVRPALERCTVYVLPSYREGTPRTVLEAMATGRPVLTTDAPGCRETIFEAASMDSDGIRWGLNGALVPVRDADALAAACCRLIENPAFALECARQSRRLAEAHYDVDKVNLNMLTFMGLLGR